MPTNPVLGHEHSVMQRLVAILRRVPQAPAEEIAVAETQVHVFHVSSNFCSGDSGVFTLLSILSLFKILNYLFRCDVYRDCFFFATIGTVSFGFNTFSNFQRSCGAAFLVTVSLRYGSRVLSFLPNSNSAGDFPVSSGEDRYASKARYLSSPLSAALPSNRFTTLTAFLSSQIVGTWHHV